MQKRVRPLQEWFKPEVPLATHAEKLADPSLYPRHSSHGVNETIMRFTVKYLLDYLMIITRNTPTIRRGVSNIIEEQALRDNGPLIRYALGRGQKTSSDFFAVQCLADVHGTSALVKEIVFQRDCSHEDNQFCAVDIGTGSGILLAAALIAGIRQKFQSITGIGFDSQSRALQNAERVFSNVPQIGKTYFIEGDISDSQLYRQYLLPPLMPKYWISETFNLNTPKIDTDEGVVYGESIVTRFLTKRLDPFVSVIENLLRIQYFKYQVQRGAASMFPNVISGDYQPDEANSRIRLHTGPKQEHIPLGEVGDEFLEFEGFGGYGINRRWQSVRNENP